MIFVGWPALRVAHKPALAVQIDASACDVWPREHAPHWIDRLAIEAEATIRALRQRRAIASSRVMLQSCAVSVELTVFGRSKVR
jgi:hypothetical protein